jgi:mannose-1-phosphate guanylyltransferase
LEELKAFHPEVYENQNWFGKQHNGILDLALSMDIPSSALIMRNGKQKIKVVSSQFGWSDLGSFESVYDYLVSIGHPVDENGNMVLGLIIIPLL